MTAWTLRRTAGSPLVATALALWLLVAFVAATPAATVQQASDETDENYRCPLDCKCVLAQNTHKPHLHAKCNSTIGLRSAEPLNSTLPIHSIDLSFMNLTRLAHALDKLPDITSIDLSHNELHEIGHLSRQVKKLNLKHNRLTSAKLRKLPKHLQVLNLQHNDITYLPKELTEQRNLMQLELSHNQINCSCETLDVRNWLQERHVYMEHPVVCSYPAETRGKSWLQVKQSDICEREQRGWFAPETDENELMLGDQPVEGSGDKDGDDDEDELGKAYLPIEDKKSGKSSEKSPNDDVEGSGDLGNMNMQLNLAEISTQGPGELRLQLSPLELASTAAPTDSEEKEEEVEEARSLEAVDEDDEGSGSGGGLLVIPSITHAAHIPDDFEAPDSHETMHHDDDDDNANDNKPLEEPAAASPSPDIFRGNEMGIFKGSEEEQPVDEDIIVPVVHKTLHADILPDVITDAPAVADDSQESEAILSANAVKKDDSNATYFLLGVIVLIVLGLILFVAIKRCKHNGNAARDAEAQRQTELLDMDKKNLGKPLQRNGNEHMPLIGEKTKLDEAKPINGSGKTKPYDTNDIKDGIGQQPLLNGNSSANGNAKEGVADAHEPTVVEPLANEPHKYYPITPRYPTPQSPRASKYAQQQQAQTSEPNNNNPEADVYLPSSPKLGRYSPVYSPETGRVKIKLTETPKPKTPMLVTRSKSNAGEIITTPVHQAQLAVAPVSGGPNGHVHH